MCVCVRVCIYIYTHTHTHTEAAGEGGLSQEAHVEEAEQTKARQVCQTAVACVRLKRLLLPKDTAVAFVANPLCCV